MPRLCLITNTAAHYRAAIYQMLDRQLGCHFVFGDRELVKNMDTSQLRHCRLLPYRVLHGGIYWLQGALRATRGYDVIINGSNAVCLSAWLLLIAARLRGQRVVHWDHGYYGREGRLKRAIKRLYFGMAHASMVYNDYSRRLMIADGINPDKITTLGNSLDYDQDVALRREAASPDFFTTYFPHPQPVLVFIGRLTAVKRLDLLLDALLLMKQRGCPAHLFIIGDGDQRSSLEEQAQRLGLTADVCFYGASYDERFIARALYNADLCVSPGNVGLTAIHALSFGCPVVSHDNLPLQMPEFEAIVEGETGTFFRYDDADSLAQTIVAWLTHKKNDRQRVRQACYDEIDRKWNPYAQFKVIQAVTSPQPLRSRGAFPPIPQPCNLTHWRKRNLR